MNCKKMMTSLTAAALCVSLAACGSTGAASGAAASSESTAAESAATSEAAPAESAAETTGSGKVTVYMPSPQDWRINWQKALPLRPELRSNSSREQRVRFLPVWKQSRQTR